MLGFEAREQPRPALGYCDRTANSMRRFLARLPAVSLGATGRVSP